MVKLSEGKTKTKEDKRQIAKRIGEVITILGESRNPDKCGLAGDDYYIELGKRIMNERTHQKMSQGELGSLWGVTQSEVSMIEGGDRRVFAKELFLLKLYNPSIDLNSLVGVSLTEKDPVKNFFH